VMVNLNITKTTVLAHIRFRKIKANILDRMAKGRIRS
jgi:hypothetical protein